MANEQIPPASFANLVSLLATQAMAALGQMPTSAGGTPTVQLPLAKHFVDTLELLQAKTKGNLSEMEASMLENMLFELRMVYVAVQKKTASG
ncbi:MAG TPA: DUF1844 domain-containing protein [Pirellulaceae bacterium]|nr:DUF1844 domain-containing protein [Pirellulaceae bacterium]